MVIYEVDVVLKNINPQKCEEFQISDSYPFQNKQIVHKYT